MATASGMSSGLNDPDKSSTAATTAASATLLPKSEKKDKRLMHTNSIKRTPGGGSRHYRSSSLENNIFMSSFSNISPFTGSPQLSIAEPIRMSPAATVSSPTSIAASPFNHNNNNNNNHHRYHNYPHSLQPMSLGHMTPPTATSSSSSLAINEVAGQKTSPASFRSSGTVLGGQSPLQPYYGTLKSKREQKRMQMGAGQMGSSGNGSSTHSGHSSMLSQRISSVDDLRPGSNSNWTAISKSQVRLMREMFEQQQQKLNSKQYNSSDGGKVVVAQQKNNNTGSVNRKYSNEEATTSAEVAAAMATAVAGERTEAKQPPAIQPCSGVLEMNKQQLIKPIAFKPIPFPADSRFMTNDRYGSTPSLNPPPVNNYNLKFGSTHDLRHNFNTIGSRKAYAYSNNTAATAATNLINYDSMESISPDSICSSQSTLKSMSQYQSDLLDTPSPSDSGISELEAALRDRDSELAYLRQTMEHNEQVIFRVQQDKERNWEEEIKRMRQIHAQRIQKFEQIAMMQSFQQRQAKKRHQEEVVQLQARIKDVERKAELQHNEIMGHKVNEKELREQCSDMMEENELMRKLVNELRSRLEESEWANCQKNGETALLKTQLKDAQAELQGKDQELAQLRIEVKMHSYNDHQLVLPSSEPDESAIIITAHPSTSSSSSSSSSPVSINHSDDSSDDKLRDDLQLSHLNRIIILKDQIIMAMTNEMQKLKKEVADLASFEAMPPGRAKQRKEGTSPQQQQQQQQPPQSANESTRTLKLYNKENVILGDYHDLLNNLKNSEDFLKCTSPEKPTLEELKNVLLNNQFGSPAQHSGRERVAINHLSADTCDESSRVNEPKRSNLDSVAAVAVPKTSEDGEQVAKLTTELADMRRVFEEERKKWTEEKEKVLVYQRQLQRNYLQICKRNESLEERVQITR